MSEHRERASSLGISCALPAVALWASCQILSPILLRPVIADALVGRAGIFEVKAS